MRILFFGTPSFAVPILEALIEGPDDLVGVLSQPDRPRGRGLKPDPTPVALRAREAGLSLFQPDRLHAPETLAQLRELSADLIVTAAFGRILRPALLSLPRYGCLNVHASLLPRHRGAAPIPRAILAGDVWTGITIFRLDEGMDTGPLLLQRLEWIRPDDTAGSLTERLSRLGAEALREACAQLRSGKADFIPQEHEFATYAPLLRKEDGACSLARPADQIDRFVRGMDPWPGATITARGESLRLVRVEPIDLIAHDVPPGTVVVVDPAPVVATLPGRIRLLRVQAPGKREMEAAAWAHGFRLRLGDRIG